MGVQAQPNTHLADVMSKTIATAFPQQLLHEVEHHFKNISGLPVIDKELKCVGVLSKKDFKKASDVVGMSLLSMNPELLFKLSCM